MSDFTRGAALAWRIAAAETGAAGHPKIDKAHMLIGILSLGKALAAGKDLSPQERAALQAENARVEELMKRLGLQAKTLRRSLRDRLGVGKHRHATGTAISRTDPCKAAFGRALALAAPGDASCLHLVAALAELADPHVDALLHDAGVKPDALARLASVMAALDQIEARLKGRGVRLAVDAAAEGFLSAGGPGTDAAAALQAVARFVGGPLDALVASGKIKRAAAWRVAHEEGGVYVIPAE